jgi:hypothetical protein
MFFQSVLFCICIVALSTYLAVSGGNRLESFAAARLRMNAVSIADVEVERVREAAATQMRAVVEERPASADFIPPADTKEGSLDVHVAFDSSVDLAAANQTSAMSCPEHDSARQCNLEVGAGVDERRVWLTIEIRTSPGVIVPLNLKRHVLLRLLHTQPYATIIAVRDGNMTLAGDAAGVAALPNDADGPQAGAADAYRDTRVHVYEPCRVLDTSLGNVARDGHNWANWQGGTAGPARQAKCDTGAGEVSRYVDAPLSSGSKE